MAGLPVAGHISDNARTQGEVKVDLDDVIAVAASGILQKTTNYTVAAPNDHMKMVTMDDSGGARTVTLPTVSSAGDGFKIAVKKITGSTNVTTIDGNGAETIDGVITFVLKSKNHSVMLQCDGTEWHILSERINNQEKGADVASTTGVMTLGDDGDYFEITGTNAITGIAALGIGRRVTLHFVAAATLTHHSTNLVLPGAGNIVTAAGDEFTFVEYAIADWRCISYALASGAAVSTAGEFAAAIEIVFGAAVPSGWTQTADNDRILRVVNGAGGGTGGTVSINGGTITCGAGTAHSHTVDGHTHTLSGISDLGGASASYRIDTLVTGSTAPGTNSESSHNHAVTSNLLYQDVTVAAKD